MIHSSKYQPRVFPITGTNDDAEIDRAQSIDPTISLNREKVEEIGRDGIVGYLAKSPTTGYRLTQYEYGNIEFYQKIVNNEAKGDTGEDAIDLNDFKTAYFDICAFLTDDDGTFKGTILYPSLRTSGFSISIGDPQAIIERSFDFVGENAKQLRGDNAYWIYVKEEVNTGELTTGNDFIVDLSTREPAEDPNTADKYMQRIIRVRSGSSSELTSDAYSYNATAQELTIADALVGDVYKIWYTSATVPATTFALNNSDPAGIIADSAEIYLYVPASAEQAGSDDYVYRLQSITLDVSFDREDLREIGNSEVVQRGVRDKTVTVTLGRILEELTVEEILSGQGSSHGIIDFSKLSDSVALLVKIYEDNTKTTFKYGFYASGLSATEIRAGVSTNEHVRRDNTLEGESLKISADITKLVS